MVEKTDTGKTNKERRPMQVSSFAHAWLSKKSERTGRDMLTILDEVVKNSATPEEIVEAVRVSENGGKNA